MEEENLISIEEICKVHHIEISFIYLLKDYGLIHIIEVEKHPHIPFSEITTVERILRMHSELEINLEGIDAIHHLLQRITNMQEELTYLKNKLRLYEDQT